MVNRLNKKQIHTLEILSEIDENNQTLLNTTMAWTMNCYQRLFN